MNRIRTKTLFEPVVTNIIIRLVTIKAEQIIMVISIERKFTFWQCTRLLQNENVSRPILLRWLLNEIFPK